MSWLGYFGYVRNFSSKWKTSLSDCLSSHRASSKDVVKNYAAIYMPGPPTREEQEKYGLSGKTLSKYGFRDKIAAWQYVH